MVIFLKNPMDNCSWCDVLRANTTVENCVRKAPTGVSNLKISNKSQCKDRRSGFGSGVPLDPRTFDDAAPILGPVERDSPPPSEDG